MIKIKSTTETLDKLLELLKKNRPFCYTRFGDSQLMMMAGWNGQDWEQIGSPKLKELQIKAFEMDEPNYLIAPSCGYELELGMRSGTFALYRNDKDLVATVEKHQKTQELWHCEAIHYGMLYNQEKTKELFQAIQKRRLMVVAGGSLDVDKWFHGKYIFTPMANAFSKWETIYNQLKIDIENYMPELVLFSCGLTAQILQYFLYMEMPNITTINMGSVFNALLGINDGLHTRAWIRQNEELLNQFRESLDVK